MSRLGKKALQIPDKVKVEFKNHLLEITGPIGKLVQPIDERLNVKIANNQVQVEIKGDSKEENRLHGLTRGLVKNALIGASQGFKKDLEVQGLGYKVALEGKNLVMQLGFSHPVKFAVPDGIKVLIDKQTMISLSGADKALVGEIAASIRSIRPPEPYKGTGIRYVGEHIIRKEGKTAAGAAGAVGGK